MKKRSFSAIVIMASFLVVFGSNKKSFALPGSSVYNQHMLSIW